MVDEQYSVLTASASGCYLCCDVVVCDQEGCKEQVDVSLGWNWRLLPKKADLISFYLHTSSLPSIVYEAHIYCYHTCEQALGVIFLIKLRNGSR